MDAKKFSEILSLAMARITREDGSIIDPATLPEGSNQMALENLWIAWTLISCAGYGPFEDQKARIEAWAAEREQRFGNVRAMLQKFGIGAHVGLLEEQVAELGSQRNRLRQLADVGAEEIQRLTMQRDAARQGIALIMAAFEADELQVRHQAVVIDKGRGHQHMAECAKDDTCQCPGRVALLKAQLATAVGEGGGYTIQIGEGEGRRFVRADQTLEQLMRIPGAANVAHVDVHADDPDRLAFGLVAGHRVAWMGPEAVEIASRNPEAIMADPAMEPTRVVMMQPADEDHDHVFIDGRCACGESVQ